MSKLTMVVAGVVWSVAVAAVGVASALPMVPLALTEQQGPHAAPLESGRGMISLIPLNDQERTLVAIAATFDASKYCGATSVIVSARINGFMVGAPFPAFVENRGAEGCVASGVFRVDLDAAELTHPGAFIGQPLNVTLTFWG